MRMRNIFADRWVGLDLSLRCKIIIMTVCYGKSELARLCGSLGFPHYFLIHGMQSASSPHLRSAYLKLSSGKSVSSKVIKELLETKHMHQRLEKIFNCYPADYNRKLFRKAMLLWERKQLSFSEISSIRIAFQLYSGAAGGSLEANTSTVLQALKMLERVMSPIQLDSEIKKQQDSVDVPSCIQMYEFMDIVVKCIPASEVEREINLPSMKDPGLTSLDEIFITKDKRILAHLDRKYRAAHYKMVTATPAVLDSSSAISVTHRQEVTEASQRQFRALTPALEYSQWQLSQARNGYSVLTGRQYQEVQSAHDSRQSSRTGTRLHSNSEHVPLRLLTGRSRSRQRFQDRNRPPLQRPETCISSKKNSWSLASSSEGLPKSKSVPSLPSVIVSHRKRDAMVVEDVDETVYKPGCEQSSSVEKVSSQVWRGAKREGTSGAAEAGSSKGRVRKFRMQPIVTEDDIRRQKDLIYELEWEKIRRNRDTEQS